MSGEGPRFLMRFNGMVFSALSRFRVFQQLLVVIAVMVTFIALEGFLSLQMIDQMQGLSRKSFTESTHVITVLTNARAEVENFRREYLANLAGISSVGLTTGPLSASLDSLGLATEDREKLTQYVQQLDQILKLPVNKENYEQALPILVLLEAQIRQYHNQKVNEAIQSMDLGNKFSRDSRITTLIILLGSMVISLGLGVLIAASISRPLRKIVSAVNALAVGDLSRKVSAAGCYEVTEVTRSLNRAVAGLSALVQGINHQAGVLIVASEDLESAATESGRSAAEVSQAMEDLTLGTSEQANQINMSVATVNELSQLVRQVSDDTARIASCSEKVAGSAVAGRNVTRTVAEEIEQLYRSTKEVAAVIVELNRASGEITEITSVIEGIAEQTTLLALNASIEAARAGIHGTGFEVVAAETGKLAEQSKKAAQMIALVISRMKGKIDQVVSTIQNGMARVEAGRKLTGAAAETFNDIFQLLGEVLSQIDQVAVSAAEMVRKNERVIGAMTSIAAISEESMAGTEQVSGAAQQQSASAEEVLALAENLAAVASGLKNSVAMFRFDQAPS
jgi:methyl-accepting chemotaxis protein